MTVLGFYIDSENLPGYKGRLWVDGDKEPFFIIEAVVGIAHFIFHAGDTPEPLRWVAMESLDRAKGFGPDGICIDDGKMFHIHGFVDVDQAYRERDCVDGTPGYTLSGRITEHLQEGCILGTGARDWQGAHCLEWRALC